MRLIGFDFTKISADRLKAFEDKYTTNTNLDIKDIIEENLQLLENQKVVKINFKFTVTYNAKDKKEVKFGEVAMEGHLLFAAAEKEAVELLESWKKKNEKNIPAGFRDPLFNLIMRKCAPKALDLEDSLGMPFHFPIPQIKSISKDKADNK